MTRPRLNLDERIAIMRGVDTGLSYADIGEQIGRDRITVWREVRRNRSLSRITCKSEVTLRRIRF
jgi:IS30 family transposase